MPPGAARGCDFLAGPGLFCAMATPSSADTAALQSRALLYACNDTRRAVLTLIRATRGLLSVADPATREWGENFLRPVRPRGPSGRPRGRPKTSQPPPPPEAS